MKKLGLPKQKKVITLFNNLFRSGFNVTEVVSFLQRSQLLENRYTQVMKAGLLSGLPFSLIMKDLGFSSQVVTQLSLAENHGNLLLCLEKIETYLTEVIKVKRKLVEVGTYPLVLLGFLGVIMVGLQNHLLPQLSTGNLATRLVGYLPQLFLATLAGTLIIAVVLSLLFRRLKRLSLICFLARIPGLKGVLKTYLTAYYAREWGNLISQGLELPEILNIMMAQSSKLFVDIGEDLQLALSQGQAFDQHVSTYPFFEKELSLMITYGEAKSKLGQELEVYAQDCWERFFAKINQAMQWIQPLVFIFVALMIVLIYAAMLLPIYHNMEVTL